MRKRVASFMLRLSYLLEKTLLYLMDWQVEDR
jgi:hypothetical protein